MSDVGFFIAPGIGTMVAWVVSLGYGPDIKGSDADGASGSVFYPQHVTGSSWTMEVEFSSAAKSNQFNRWMLWYTSNLPGPMTVRIPSADFVRTGIPKGDFTLGDTVGIYKRRQRLRFEGTSDPIAPGTSGSTGDPALPDDTTSRMFYPTGVQLEGFAQDEDLYDADPAEILDPNVNPSRDIVVPRPGGGVF